MNNDSQYFCFERVIKTVLYPKIYSEIKVFVLEIIIQIPVIILRISYLLLFKLFKAGAYGITLEILILLMSMMIFTISILLIFIV